MCGPSLNVIIDPCAIPHVVYTTIPVPAYWQETVRHDLDRDVRLGVIEPIPWGTYYFHLVRQDESIRKVRCFISSWWQVSTQIREKICHLTTFITECVDVTVIEVLLSNLSLLAKHTLEGSTKQLRPFLTKQKWSTTLWGRNICEILKQNALSMESIWTLRCSYSASTTWILRVSKQLQTPWDRVQSFWKLYVTSQNRRL